MSDIEPICRKCGKSIPDGSWAGVKMARRGFEYEHLQCPSPCPSCEAAARERDALQAKLDTAMRACEDAYESHASIVLRSGIERILADYPRDIKQDAEEALRALVAGTVAPVSGDSDLRERLAALADEWMENGVLARLEGDTEAANGIEWHALKLRALLAQPGARQEEGEEA